MVINLNNMTIIITINKFDIMVIIVVCEVLAANLDFKKRPLDKILHTL